MSDHQIIIESGGALVARFKRYEDAPVVMFGNSLASDMSMWREVIAALGNNTSTLTCDTRGHGASVSNGQQIEIETLGQDVIRVLDHFEIKKVIYVGLSLGGLIGMWLAANQPTRVFGLVLANTAPNFPPPPMWYERAAIARRDGFAPLVQAALNRWLTPRFQSCHVQRTAEIAQMIGATPAEGYALCCEALAKADLRKSLSQIKCHVEVIAGTHDVSTPPARLREILELVGGGGFLEVDAAHLAAVEVPEAFAGIIHKLIQNTSL